MPGTSKNNFIINILCKMAGTPKKHFIINIIIMFIHSIISKLYIKKKKIAWNILKLLKVYVIWDKKKKFNLNILKF